jgi:hypothetical protein
MQEFERSSDMTSWRKILWNRLCRNGGRALRTFRSSVWAAIDQEHARSEGQAAADEQRDLFERLPEPLHLDHGDVKFTDGKLRFLD